MDEGIELSMRLGVMYGLVTWATGGLGGEIIISVFYYFFFRLLAQRKAQSSVAPSDADSDEIITDLSYSKER